MKNRAVDAAGADARRCECERPWAQRVVDGGSLDCLKCGREIGDARATQGLLNRAVSTAIAAVQAAESRRAASLPEP